MHLEGQIKAAHAEIAIRKRQITALEQKIALLQREVDTFRRAYERALGPVMARLEAARAAIAELEHARLDHHFAVAPPSGDDWTPPDGYIPVEEQFRRTWKTPPPAADPSPLTPSIEAEVISSQLKRLYRVLARRFHPDLAQSEVDRIYRTRLMTLINEAYAAREIDVLVLVAEQGIDDPQAPLDALRLHALRKECRALDDRLADLESVHRALLNSEWMGFKIDVSLAQGRQRDLLRELAAALEQEYAVELRRLDQLRRA